MARTNAENCRSGYARHRAKRLAAKKAKRDSDPEAARAYTREMYAKHKEKRVAAAREYRRKNADVIAARAKAKYDANRDAINERRKGYKETPEQKLKAMAKRILSAQSGAPYRAIPDDLAEAKMAQLEIGRWAKEALKDIRKS